MEAAPSPKVLAIIGEAWAPYRTIASWYLWQVPKVQ
jgi:DNA-3-methyladenine glycosylase II